MEIPNNGEEFDLDESNDASELDGNLNYSIEQTYLWTITNWTRKKIILSPLKIQFNTFRINQFYCFLLQNPSASTT